MGLDFNKMDELGRGAHSIVFKGSFYGKPVAVKRIDSARLGDVNEREEKAMQTLDHPNVLKLLHVEVESDFRKFVLELCVCTLSKIPEDIRKVLPSDGEALVQMARGLAYIHNKKFVHRDIKPENILIQSNLDGVVFKISDFGYCKPSSLSGRFSMSGARGTTNFMAPEVLRLLANSQDSGPIEGRNTVDIFSLGCVFYCYLTEGNHPFGHPLFITGNIVSGKSSLKDMNEGCPFRQLIGEMIDMDPLKRPNAQNVVTWIENWQLSTP